MKNTAAIIPAGGCGNFGDGKPKLLHLLPNGRSIISQVLYTVRDAGIDHIVVTENNYKFRRQVAEHLSRNGLAGLVTFAHQNERSGAGKAVQIGLSVIEDSTIESILTIYGDMPLWRPETISELVKFQQTEGVDVALVSIPLSERTPEAFKSFGRIIRKNGRITEIYEPSDHVDQKLIDEADSVSPSLFVFDRTWLEAHLPLIEPVDPGDGFEHEYHLPKVLLTDDGEKCVDLPLSVDRLDEARGINTPQEYKLACEIFAKRGG